MRLFFTKRVANQKIARAKSSLWLSLFFALLIVGCNPEDSTETEPTAELGTLTIADLKVDIYSNAAAASSNARVEAFSTWEHIFEDEVTLNMENTFTGIIYEITFNPNALDNTVNITLPYGFYRYTLDTDLGGEMEDFLPFTASGVFEIAEENYELEIEGETNYGLITLTNSLITSATLTSATQTQSLALNDDELHFYKYVELGTEVTLDIVESYSNTDLSVIIDVDSYEHYHYNVQQPSESTVTFAIVIGVFNLQETILEIGRVRDIDGNSYRITMIDDQVWMAENLNVSRFRNGDIIPEVTTEADWEAAGINGTPAWCYYNNDPANGDTFGKLYNWHAVNDPRGLAPVGYHIPNDVEWNILEAFLGTNAGGKLKQTGTSIWISPNTDATNFYGFSALPSGARTFEGDFSNIGTTGFFWTNSLVPPSQARRKRVNNTTGEIHTAFSPFGSGFPVRAIRD
ncbi:fibrobacter succinogenes major paralogous domain-containing protein [Peijinzhouia sedimentorum]